MLTLKISYPTRITIRSALRIVIDASGIDIEYDDENDLMHHIPKDSFIAAYIMNEAGKTVEIISGRFGCDTAANVGQIDNPNN